MRGIPGLTCKVGVFFLGHTILLEKNARYLNAVSPAYSGEITNHRDPERMEKTGPSTAEEVSTKGILCQKIGDPVCHNLITVSIFQLSCAYRQS